MPKESCIQHIRRADFIVLRKHMVELFDGDHCAAVILAYFEYATNGEMDRLSRQGEQDGIPFGEEPWVKATMPSIYEETVGLFSIRTLQDRIDKLVRIGLLQEAQAHIGRVKRYLLNVDAVNEAIASRTVYAIGNFADERSAPSSAATSAPPSAPPSAKTTHDEGEKNLKGREERSTKEENPSPPLPTVDSLPQTQPLDQDMDELYLDDPVQKFATDAYRRVTGVRLRHSKSDRRLWEEVVEKEASMGRTNFRLALLAYLADNKTPWLRDNQWPIRYFLKGTGQWENIRPVRRLPVAAAAAVPAVEAPAPPEQHTPFHAVWNAIVTAAPVEAFLGDTQPTAYGDATFRARFEELCSKVQEIRQAKDDAGWLNFHWILKRDKDAGVYNWQRILAGDFDWMLKKSKAVQKEDVIAGGGLFEDLRKKREERRKNAEAQVQD